MTQVLQHDYGKSRVSLLQIRAAIKAVNKERSGRGVVVSPRKPANSKKSGRVVAASSRKPA